MAKQSSFKILNTNSWEEAQRFVKQPVATKKVHGKVLIFNSETKKTYGLRSASYELIRHEDALQAFHKALILEEKQFELVSVQLDNAGARMFAHVKIFDQIEGWLATPRLVLTNSYDGTLSFGIDCGLMGHETVALLGPAERWIHFGNSIDIDLLRKAIKKGLREVKAKAAKLLALNEVRLENPRLSLEWFWEKKIITLPVVEDAVKIQPYTGHLLFLALIDAITHYETSPTRKRDMYFAVTNALLDLRRWANPVDKRRAATENKEASS